MVCQMEYFRSIEGKIFGGQTLSFSKYGKKLISCDIGGIVIYHIPDVADSEMMVVARCSSGFPPVGFAI